MKRHHRPNPQLDQLLQHLAISGDGLHIRDLFQLLMSRDSLRRSWKNTAPFETEALGFGVQLFFRQSVISSVQLPLTGTLSNPITAVKDAAFALDKIRSHPLVPIGFGVVAFVCGESWTTHISLKSSDRCSKLKCFGKDKSFDLGFRLYTGTTHLQQRQTQQTTEQYPVNPLNTSACR